MARIAALLLASAALLAGVATTSAVAHSGPEPRHVTADDGFGWGTRPTADDDGFGWGTPRDAVGVPRQV